MNGRAASTSSGEQSQPHQRVLEDRRARPTSFTDVMRWGGRRRGSRRQGEERDSYVDHARQQVALLVLVVLCSSVLDGALTLVQIDRGSAEANPLMAITLDGGESAFLLAKLTITGLGVWLLAAHQNFRIAWVGLRLLAAAYVPEIMLPGSHPLANFLMLWTGCMAGVWLSVGARRIVFDLGDLHIPRHDRLEPWVRLTLAGLFSLSLGILFSTGTLVIAVGSVETWQFREQPEIAVLIGLLCGFIEQGLSARAASRARDVLQLEIL